MADEMPRPPDKDSKQSADEKSDARRLFRLLGLGLQLTVTVAIFAALGWWVDEHWGWTWGKQGLSLFGIALGLYMFVKEATK